MEVQVWRQLTILKEKEGRKRKKTRKGLGKRKSLNRSRKVMVKLWERKEECGRLMNLVKKIWEIRDKNLMID
jgi:hypothetical protein